MKKLLTSLFIALLCGAAPPPVPSLAAQTRHCEKVLWFEQKQFDLAQFYMTIQVKRAKDMKHPNAWGAVELSNSGPVIEIMAMEDYNAGMTLAERQHHQDEVVVHEVLHVVLIREGVPSEVQDAIIEAIRSGVKLP